MTLRILIDTDKLIDIEKGVEELPEYDCYVSIITLYEFIRGRKDFSTVKRLMELLLNIISLDNKIILKATEIWRELRSKGELIDDRDLLIGTTAIVYNMPLFTGNRKHFNKLEKYGLKFYEKEDKRWPLI